MAYVYKNPIGAGLYGQRIDQGVDYGGSGPLYALSSGVITNVYGSGWPGGAFIEIHLDDGRYVFYAEDIAPSVHVGQRVSAGQLIGRATGGGDGIEVGWGSGKPGVAMARAAGQTAAGDRSGDPGRYTTAYGQHFSNFIHSLGAPAGHTYGPIQGSVPGTFGRGAPQVSSAGSSLGIPAANRLGDPNPSASDYQVALGSLAGLLTAIPELHSILQKAVQGGWAVTKFQQAIQQSHWYRSSNAATRELVALSYSDPAEYRTRVAQASAQVAQIARQMGVPLNAGQLAVISHEFLTLGWTTATLQADIARQYNLKAQPQGQAAGIYQQLTQLYGDYGVPYNFATVQYRTQQILAGRQTIDTYKQNAINAAKSLYPGVAGQIDQGITVRQIADPYINAQANLLEIDPQSINIGADAGIKRALQGTPNATGVKVATPLWQYEQQVRSDPRWQFTNNSRDVASSALVQLGADFGFGPKG